jgi:hypothetical protein
MKATTAIAIKIEIVESGCVHWYFGGADVSDVIAMRLINSFRPDDHSGLDPFFELHLHMAVCYRNQSHLHQDEQKRRSTTPGLILGYRRVSPPDN